MHRSRPSRPDRVREPVQVYLDRKDRDLLEQLAESTGLPRTEVIRRGLRALAADQLASHPPGGAMESLIGAFGDGPGDPADFSERHDAYLAQALEGEHRR